LKLCASELAPAIVRVFQTSLDSGTVPSDWKEALITPLFKKGERNVASNYRPVSLTSVVLKQNTWTYCPFIDNETSWPS